MQCKTKASLVALAALALAPVVYGFTTQSTYFRDARRPLGSGVAQLKNGRGGEVGQANELITSPARTLSHRGEAPRDVNREVARALTKARARDAGAVGRERIPAPYIYTYEDDALPNSDGTNEFAADGIEVVDYGSYPDDAAYVSSTLPGSSIGAVRVVPDSVQAGGYAFDLKLPIDGATVRVDSDGHPIDR